MADDIETDPNQDTKSKLPVVALAILGLALAGYCIFGAITLLKPALSNATLKPTHSAATAINPTSTPTLANNIQILATNSVNEWPIIFSDTFDENQNIWPIENTSGSEYDDILEIKEGKYLWSFTSKKEFFARTTPIVLPVTDFHLSADLKLTRGTYKPVYGLVFRDNSNGDLYKFGVYGEGFVVDMYYNQAWTSLIEYTKTSAISPQESNRLSIIAEGSHFIFFINDQYVAEMTDDHIKDGVVGFGVDVPLGGLQNSFEFDNFELRAPKK